MPRPRRQRGRIRPARDENNHELRGVWEVSWDIGDGTATGRRRRSKRVHGSKADAQHYLRDRLSEVDQGRSVARHTDTLGTYLESWFAGLDTSRTAPRTRERYGKLIEQHIKPRIGDVRLQNLDAPTLSAFYADCRSRGRLDKIRVKDAKTGKTELVAKPGGLSPTTVRQIHAILHRSLKAAARARLVTHNPCDDLDETPKAAIPDARRLTTADVNAILEAVSTAKHTNLMLPVVLFATTGARRGEVLALRWRDCDLQAGTVRIARALYKVNGELAFKEPKTRQFRTLMLPTPALAALRARWNERERLRKEISGFDDGDLVCTRVNWRTGRAADPIDPDTLSSSFTRFCERHGFGHVGLHMLRHGHARTLLQAGTDIKTISRRLGHATIQTTANVYLGDDADMDKAAAARLDGLYTVPPEGLSRETGGATDGVSPSTAT